MPTALSQQDSEHLEGQAQRLFIRQVRIQGYRSISLCQVALQPLTVLVGRNGAGKSNFLDALAFLRDGVAHSVAEAIRRRGGLPSIVCRSASVDRVTVVVEVGFAGDEAEYTGRYGLTIPVGEPSQQPRHEEWLRLEDRSGNRRLAFKASGGKAVWERDGLRDGNGLPSTFPPDHLFLSVLGGQPFAQLASELRWLGTYNFQPEAMRPLQKPNSALLQRDGRNLATVLFMLQEKAPQLLQRAKEYLAVIAPEIQDVTPIRLGDYETVRFLTSGGIEFNADSMSDGTLCALASLVAAFQVVPPRGHASLIGIEEPETALHPAATSALVDALLDATDHTQVVLTTHSADLLAARNIRPSQVLVVRSRKGQTQLTPIDAASRDIVHRKLYSLADLQRMDQLDLDAEDLDRQAREATQGGEK